MNPETSAALSLLSAEAVRNRAQRMLALGLKATQLGELLDTAPETISRWETGKRPPERGAVVIVAALVDDELSGRTTTADRIRALHHPHKLGKRVRLTA